MTVPPSRTGAGRLSVTWVEEFGGFFEDAALFPPGNAPMATAVTRHWEHRDAWYGPAVGTFVCPDRRWDELIGRLDAEGPVLDLSLVVVGDGPESLAACLARTQAHPRVRLRAVELPVTGSAPGGLEVLLQTVAAVVPRTVTVYAEVGLGPGVHQAVRAVAQAGFRAKFRTGGTRADAFPGETRLAEGLVCALRLGVPFKLTAGLHHAVRHTGSDTGFEHHGFLNVMVAVAAAHDGADEETITSVLACREPESLARRCTPRQRAAARTWFTSFGTCSVDEPLADLSALRLVGKD